MLAAVVYGIALDRSPIYLTHDEVIYARNAYSIAATGRDLSGQFLPISIPVTGTFYATPANIYLTAAFLKVLPLSEITVRLPSVLVGLLCVWLVYLIARRLLRSERFGIVAATLLLLTPAHFIHSRLGTDHLYLVACVLAWLLILVTDDPGTNAKRLFIATAFLGLSLYTYIGALITAPICVALTLCLAGDGQEPPRLGPLCRRRSPDSCCRRCRLSPGTSLTPASTRIRSACTRCTIRACSTPPKALGS